MADLTIDELKKKLPPKEYREKLKEIEIVEIFLVSINSKLDREKIFQEMEGIDTNFSKSCDIQYLENNTVVFCVTFKLTAKSKKKPKSKPLLECMADFDIVFKSNNQLPAEFWEIYKAVNITTIIWPYLRELVQDITAKMNIPPLTLPFYPK